MIEQLPPYWAYVRSCELSGRSGIEERLYDTDCAFTEQTLAFARYIAEHEEAPVDPIVLEARNLVECTVHWSPQTDRDLQSGKNDDSTEMKIAIAAIRRGIEIGKGEK